MADDELAELTEEQAVACHYLRTIAGHSLADCKRCPEWEDDPDYGKTQRMCRAMAVELAGKMAAARRPPSPPAPERIEAAARVLCERDDRDPDATPTDAEYARLSVESPLWRNYIHDAQAALKAADAVSPAPPAHAELAGRLMTLHIESRPGGWFFVTSPEHRGLLLTGPDLADILKDVPEALALLREAEAANALSPLPEG